jgi:hypothetical protein
MRTLAGVLVTLAALVLLGFDIAGHYLGYRFALGTWPVPQGTPWTYQFESGFLPALTVITLLSFLSGAWRHVNCHHPRCYRFGRHKIDGTPWCDIHQKEARPDRTEHEVLLAIEKNLADLVKVLQDKM